MKHLLKFAVFSCLLGTFILLDVPGTFAQGEHNRRLAANLLVLQADIKLLGDSEATELRQQGLRLRVQEKLGMLELLVRYADQESKHTSQKAPVVFNNLLLFFKTGNFSQLNSGLENLISKYPLLLSPALQTDSSQTIHKRAENIHKTLCLGCHSGALSNNELPAFDLFRQSRTMSRIEFVARLITGLRGDQLTSLENPFPDADLAAMTSYYRTAVRGN
ncbi:MAG: hypothetical protein H8E38_14040 [SAR324 cluster bacterium]|nr:hypothetical protein [SAR324 cluster bacterium]MBL7035618.1 hypothetical protein [SAR324 cluster bacterium]